MTKEVLKLALEAYLCREMPAGTVIGDPKWWVPKIAIAIKEALMSLQDGAQPEQEPVGEVIRLSVGGDVDWFSYVPEVGTLLYTTPPQRKPLTDEEIMDMYNEPRSDAEMIAFGREVEAKLKEKNT